MNRLFVALPIDKDVQELLYPTYEYLLSQDYMLKTVSPENYHITVKFLGECEGNVANAIESTFLGITIPQGEIPYTVKGLGTFPDIKKPSVLWAGLDTDQNRISQIHKAVDSYASNFKFKEEREEFIPHITLARIRKGRKIAGDLLKYIETNDAITYGQSTFKKLSLYSSKLTPDGPVYSEIKSIKL
jgi:RNA 2',3'-cyclic 3'-phosphodiesterase